MRAIVRRRLPIEARTDRQAALLLAQQYKFSTPSGDGLMESVANCYSYIWISLDRLVRQLDLRKTDVYEDAIQSAVAAVLVCVQKGEIIDGRLLTKAGRRYVRREIHRSICMTAGLRVTEDHGFNDGRHSSQEHKRTEAKNKNERYVKANAALGKCSKCGSRRPPPGYKVCDPCRELKKKNKAKHKHKHSKPPEIMSKRFPLSKIL